MCERAANDQRQTLKDLQTAERTIAQHHFKTITRKSGSLESKQKEMRGSRLQHSIIYQTLHSRFSCLPLNLRILGLVCLDFFLYPC